MESLFLTLHFTLQVSCGHFHQWRKSGVLAEVFLLLPRIGWEIVRRWGFFELPQKGGAQKWVYLLDFEVARVCFLVHHNAATRNAAMHNAIFSHRSSYPLFYSVIAVMPFSVFQHRP